MSYGSNQEYLIFPIIELIRKELKSQINSGSMTQYGLSGNSTKGGVGGSGDILMTEGNKTVINYGNLLSRLESNDYELELQRSDPNFPNRLTGVKILFGEDLLEVITLIRDSNKLKYVTMGLIVREKADAKLINPYGMNREHFIQYMQNKNMYMYYTEAKNSTYESCNLTDAELDALKLEADAKISLAESKNQGLRNLYGIPSTQDMKYSELKQYLPNPLAMDMYDYIDYAFQKWIWLSEHSSITQQVKDDAHSLAVTLRKQYNIVSLNDFTATTEEIDLPYTTDSGDNLFMHLPNPLGMHESDFKQYCDLRSTYDGLDPSDPQQAAQLVALQQEITAYLDKYYIVDDTYTTEELKEYLLESSDTYDQKMILKILLTLINDSYGRLTNVKSETLESI